MLGPTGIGVLFARKELLEGMEPFIYGGDMISSVSYTDAKWNELPWKFEAGTPNIAGAAGFSAAIDYLKRLGMENVHVHETGLTSYALGQLQDLRHLTIYGPKDAKERGGVISFSLGDIHPHDLSTLLDRDGIEVRAGHHCAMPLTRLLGVTATTRASFYIYNTKEEIDAIVSSLENAARLFRL
jgi:cysteine desulfurase/selenocysteine lyase